MNLPTRMITRGALMAATATALTLPLYAHEVRFARLTIAQYSGDDDGGLLFSGSPVVLTDPSHRSTNQDWMQFRTDPCGELLRVENRRSIFRQSAFRADDDSYGFDEDDPSEMAREMIETWLSEHPEIAVINDGIDKGCDDGRFDDGNAPEESDSAEIA